MTTSVLTTSPDELVTRLISRLTGVGYPFNPLTTSFSKYLSSVVEGLSGGSRLYLTRSDTRLLADLLTALGGFANPLITSDLQLMADIIDVASAFDPLLIISGGSLKLIAGGSLLLTGI